LKCQQAGRGHFCRSSGDPHFGTFSGQKYDLYKVGDYVLVKTPGFRVDTRQMKWNKAAVNVRFAAIVNEETDRVEVITEEKVLVNGRLVRLNVGQVYTFPRGGSIHRHQSNRIKVTAKNGSYIDAIFNHGKGWPLPQYADYVVFLPHLRGARGLCVSPKQEKRAVGLFAHEYNPHFPQTKKLKSTPEEKARATKKCVKAGVKKSHTKMCVTDLIQSGFSIHARSIRKLEKRMKKDEKKFAKKQAVKRRHGRHHRRHHGRRHRRHHGRRHHGKRHHKRHHGRRHHRKHHGRRHHKKTSWKKTSHETPWSKTPQKPLCKIYRKKSCKSKSRDETQKISD